MRGAMLVVGVLPASLFAFAFVTAVTLSGMWAAVAHTAICSMLVFKGFDLREGFAARAVRKAPQVD